jgi:hypothetical protein
MDRSHPNIKQKDMQQINMNSNELPLARYDGYSIKEDTQFSGIEFAMFSARESIQPKGHATKRMISNWKAGFKRYSRKEIQ